MPEAIDNGVTGMIVDDLDAAAVAMTLVGRLDRATIRETAVRRFGRDCMVNEYVTVYEQTVMARDGGGLNATPQAAFCSGGTSA